MLPQDLNAFGMIPEFIGRTPVITETRALDEDDLVRILTEPRNAIVKQYRRMFQLEGVDLEFEPEALREVARMALARKTGARACAPSARTCSSRRCSTCRASRAWRRSSSPPRPSAVRSSRSAWPPNPPD